MRGRSTYMRCGGGEASKEGIRNNHPLELYSSRVFLFKFNQPSVYIRTTQFQLFLILYIILYFFFCRNRYCSKLLQETMISLLSERLRIKRLRPRHHLLLPVLTIPVGRFQCEEFQAHEKRGEHVSKNFIFCYTSQCNHVL